MTYFRVDFDSSGQLLKAAQRDALLAFVQKERPETLLMVAHGWLNDTEASGRMFAWFAEAMRPVAVCGVAWPSHPLKRNAAGIVKAGIEATSYYVMKERAAEVGAGGVAPLVRVVRQVSPETGVHLAGHSFGARLATSAAMALGRSEGEAWIESMLLLQGAFSQFAFSPQGFYRPVVAERMVRGPIVVTHSVHDKAVGMAYPVASLLKKQNASGLGGPNDPYGGLGANGARGLSAEECIGLNLGDTASLERFLHYPVINLNADRVILGHSDIYKPQVADTLRVLFRAAQAVR
ncbi:MAG: alpha/beta hydrolase [Bryobacteraceae bacterium]